MSNLLLLLSILCLLRQARCFPADEENAKGQPYRKIREFFPGSPDGIGGFERRSSSRWDCVGPDGRKGRCAHPRLCLAEEYGSNLTLAMDRPCVIESAYVGVCCPRRAGSVEEVRTVGSRTTRLESVLPMIAADNETTRRTNADVSESGNSRASRGCGMASKSGTRLVGGRPADPKEWPWMAALLRRNAGQYCGGVLITDRHVLTAAHCVHRYRPRDLTIRLGEYDFTRAEETRALDFAVSEIRVHRDFDYGSYENDIAIAKLHRPTVFDGYVWPVCLPPIERTFENETAVVTGWGTMYYGGPASTVLMEVAVPIWSQDRCVRSFAQRVPDTTMCAGGYDGGRDACQGDSGGPLLLRLANGRWVNVGIVSWGIRCGEPGHPGIYTRVNAYLDWIFANAVF